MNTTKKTKAQIVPESVKSKNQWWKNQNMYKTLIDSLPQKIFLQDENIVFVSGNKRFTDDLNITPESIEGKSLYSLFPEDLADKYFADSKRILESGKTEEIIEKYLVDGQERVVQTTKTPVKDELGNNIGILGIFWDITEKIRTEADIRERMRELNCLYSTSRALQDTGREISEALQEVADLIPPSMKYPEITCTRIAYYGHEFSTADYEETEWKLAENIVLFGDVVGFIEVSYLKKMPDEYNGPFLKEEMELLESIALHIGKFIERKQAVEITQSKYGQLEQAVDIRTKELQEQTRVLEAINIIFRESIVCETDAQVAAKCLSVAEELTGSRFGIIGEINSAGRLDTIAISNPWWDACRMPESDATRIINNMEVGGIWGQVIIDGKTKIVNEPDKHPGRVGLPEGHPPLTAFLGVPLNRGEEVIGMIALGNKKDGYGIFDQKKIEMLAGAFVEALLKKRIERELSAKANEILDISTPILEIWTGIVAAPLIGVLDSQRTQQFTEKLLEKIVRTNSPVAIIDITGVPVIDTQTAQHLIETITSVRLLGSQVILTGVRPSIAQTLVHLGIDLSCVVTRSSLVSGLRVAFEMLNYKIPMTNGIDTAKSISGEM